MKKKFTFTSKIHTLAKRRFWYKRDECKARGIEFDLDIDWFFKKLLNGCELTGIPFETDIKKINMKTASVDRINPGGGYTKDNCRMILFGLNAMRTYDPNPDTMYEIAEAMYEIAEALLDPLPPVSWQTLDSMEKNKLLTLHFTSGQKEIIEKKLEGDLLTKTNGEYYSRKIKPRLKLLSEAGANWASELLIEFSR